MIYQEEKEVIAMANYKIVVHWNSVLKTKYTILQQVLTWNMNNQNQTWTAASEAASNRLLTYKTDPTKYNLLYENGYPTW